MNEGMDLVKSHGRRGEPKLLNQSVAYREEEEKYECRSRDIWDLLTGKIQRN